MKNSKLFLIAIVIFALFSCKQNETTNTIPDISKTKEAELLFSKLKMYLQKDKNNIWNHQLYGPLMLVDTKSRIFIANQDGNKGFKKQNNVFVGKLPEKINIANTAFNWQDKRWTMVILPLPTNFNDKLCLLCHELFHRIQPEIGFKNLPIVNNHHLDTKNGRIYLKLELSALKQALKCKTNDQITHNLKNAIAFRLMRYKLFPDADSLECNLDILEGLAEYTGVMLSDRSNKELKTHLINKINEGMQYKTFVRSFPYLTIPVYGFFIQAKKPKWNIHINDKTNLTQYIIKQLGFTDEDIETNLSGNQKNEYNYNSIVEIENARLTENQQIIAHYDSIFCNQPILLINLVNMNIKFDPRQSIAFKDIGTIYPTIRITDDWGVLNASKGALVSSDYKKVTLTKPLVVTDTLITGNGWTLKLNKNFRVIKESYNFIIKKQK